MRALGENGAGPVQSGCAVDSKGSRFPPRSVRAEPESSLSLTSISRPTSCWTIAGEQVAEAAASGYRSVEGGGRVHRLDGRSLSATRWTYRAITISTASCGGTCSQIRRTSKPRERRRAALSASLARFPSILSRQKDSRVFGMTKWSGQPCQKQPSTKTYRPARVNTMSARLRRSKGSSRSTRKRKPARWSNERSATSGPVSRPLFACMVRRVAGETGGSVSAVCESAGATHRSNRRSRDASPGMLRL